MPLVSGKQMLEDAYKKGYAVGAFSVDHLNSIVAVIKTAEEMESPVIVQTGQGTFKQTRMNYLAALVKEVATEAKIPVALHLDHGTGFEQAIHAIRCGYTSLMFDGSRLNIEENISITQQIKKASSTLGLPLEAELGKLGTRGQDEFQSLTDPGEAEFFVRKTNVNSLAVALGNIHAAYGEEININLGHLKIIHDRVGIPMVLHGGTGVSHEDIKKAIQLGISKVNIATEWRRATVDYLRRELSDENQNDFFTLNMGVQNIICDIVRTKITLFGSQGKA
ncbi:fructose-bisphosphate aldolase [Pullulanibacillus camelliae]|uniref:Fructose-bisphosphate aldolase n=1 Tax=Pullulanibacillus camelliae TaxID=1707096 RepID=A0A8J2VJK5_9BACL|nr:class II fructose-bisphosphate aldolase [Pullulanibacillus camelliae]GGE27762.1 fructose-bisphosphate aldolase [Pullulanibacillus camelliae]